MFTKAKNKTERNKINGCKVIEPSKKTKNFPFNDHVVFLNRKNQMGFEENDYRIRIDGVVATDEESFKQIMDTLVNHAKCRGYNKLMFCDELSEGILKMFFNYGFFEKDAANENENSCNYCLYLELNERE